MHNNIEKSISIINKFISLFNKFDIQNLSEILTDDFEFKNISHGEVTENTSTLIEFALILEQSKTLFSKRTVQIQNINVSGAIFDASIICNATMAISTIDGLKAGQEISFRGTLTFSIFEDKINKVVQIS